MRAAAAVLLAALSTAGLAGGFAFLVAPDGSAFGLTTAVLPDWYPGDYLAPGLVLLVGFGAGAAVALALLLVRHRLAWSGVIAAGTGLVVWMGLQLAMIGFILPAVQVGFAALGAAMLVVGTIGARARIEARGERRATGAGDGAGGAAGGFADTADLGTTERAPGREVGSGEGGDRGDGGGGGGGGESSSDGDGGGGGGD